MNYTQVPTKPPGGFKAPGDFDFTGCRLKFPAAEYINEAAEEGIEGDLKERFGHYWRTKTATAVVVGRKSAHKWLIQDELSPGEPFAEFAGYILARLAPDSPNLPTHPQYPSPLELTDGEQRRLAELSLIKSL